MSTSRFLKIAICLTLACVLVYSVNSSSVQYEEYYEDGTEKLDQNSIIVEHSFAPNGSWKRRGTIQLPSTATKSLLGSTSYKKKSATFTQTPLSSQELQELQVS